MANTNTPSLLTLSIQECEHDGDIENTMADIAGCTVLKQCCCEGPEVGFVVVSVTNEKTFQTSLKAQGFANVVCQGDDLDNKVSQEEGEYDMEDEDY